MHAPQFPYTGTATDLPLMGDCGWLESYAFPAERRLRRQADGTARAVYQRVVATTLRHATTTAVYFATLDAEPCQVLVDVCVGQGQRALIGKVCMDRNAPEDYCQSTQQNVDETVQVMEYIYERAGKRQSARKHDDDDDDTDFADDPTVPLPLVLPVITPRFIPTCTPELLSQLGQLAAAHQNCHITTHASESWDEVAFSRQCDDDGRTDCEILDAHQLLTRHCLLAHAVHLTPSDGQLLRRRGAAIAHCPLSNFYFAGQCLPCRRLLSRPNDQDDGQDLMSSIPVGLGTDVAGGYSPSMMNAARMAVIASHALQQQDYKPNSRNDTSNTTTTPTTTSHVLDYRHAFYLATLGGATALRLQHRIGTFAVGMELDAFVWSVDDNNVPWFPATDTIQDVFQKLCTLGDDRNVQRVFVQGREVYNNNKQ